MAFMGAVEEESLGFGFEINKQQFLQRCAYFTESDAVNVACKAAQRGPSNGDIRRRLQDATQQAQPQQ